MSENVVTHPITLDSREEAVLLFGPRDSYLRTIRDALGVKLVARGDLLQIEGPVEAVEKAERAVQQLRQLLRRRGRLQAEDVRTVLDVVRGSGEAAGHLTLMESGRGLRARTDGQGRYVQALRTHDVVLCVGPAGTGKTYLAVGWAVGLLRSGQVRKIVLVRPAVEAGERLGFLPGDLVAKVNPYLRPLFDALNEIMDAETVKRYMDNDIIEILPLAYMRGRTLNNAVIILDEGQNATPAQMKMFLTRLGINSKIVVTGDLTQTDLPRSIKSGLEDAVQRLRDVEGVAIVYLDESDIIRNPLVTRIVKAYEEPAAKGKRS
ncbi:PhoH family protein [Thermogemmata fonticola]|jgi:phosphate starvation-inducible PhoH-like protein|uniref:PhoH-like protein n=1 Tax=Thermogemmata fonticola TaxID=2755323 RepID=A0A7V9AB43_9BACT|nr:PhoH family protein [Thermogemmata fonticola]MBA2225663.1 PhoH family protein [Thermogemmata fonticola]